MPGCGHAPRDRDGDEERLVELMGRHLGVEVVALPVEGEEPFDLIGPAGDLVEVAEVVPRRATSTHIPGGHDDLLEIDVHRRLGFLPEHPRVCREPGRGQRHGPPQLPDATHEALPKTWKTCALGGGSR